MYKFIKIRHDIIKQCHVNYKEMKKFNYKLEIKFLEIPHKKLGVLRGSCQGFGCQKRHPDALLAKTMRSKKSKITHLFSCRVCKPALNSVISAVPSGSHCSMFILAA